MSGNMIPIAGESKKRICYFFDSDIGNYHYGPGHPMKPHRIRMTHALVMNYGLYKKMEIFRAKPATRKEMAQFHTDDYVDFLSKVTPDNMDEFLKEQAKFNLGDDCPVFDGLFEYCSISAGGSMEGAARLSRDKCDIAVNWAGGLHHAKKAEANGFCYVNDIVLGILELLRYHKRVLYVDIDVHHGDGVEEAFYTTDRVMTCSFHKYGEFFPGTGELRDTGHGKGKYYAVNFPLRDGITDEAYKNIFEPVITKIMETYQPSAIVLQCGGDSLSGDRLGSFNVSMRGHANCVRFIKSLGLPLLLLGGGGYTIRNVSRTWAYETGLAAGQELCPDIPMNEYYEYYGPTYRLDVPPSNMEDMNITKYLEKTKIQIFENLRHTIPVPSVGLQAIPRLPHDEMDVDEDLDDPNERKPQRLLDGLIQRDDEFSDSEDEGEGGRRNVQSHKRARRQSPKLNGNGMLGLHPGSHNPLSQTQRAPDLNFNRLAPSRHSSLSSSATTSIKDIQMIHNSETSSNNAVPIPQNYKTLGPTPHTTSQNKESKPTLADLSHSSASPLAQAPAMVDMPMLSQDDQIELEKLASEALATSPELHPTKQPEEPSKATKMDIDEAVPKSIVIDAEQVKPFTSSVGLGITQAESGGSNGSCLKENTCSNPQTTLVAQRALDNDSQPLTTGLTQPSETIPAAQSENLSTAIQSHITHSDPLEGVTDEFVSEIAQAIAEGEAATGSQAIIPCPPSTSVAGNSNPDLDSVKKDSEIMDPRLKPISGTSFQWSSQGSLNRNHDESMQVDEFQDPDRLAIETTTPIDTDDGDEKFQSEGAHENADTSDHKGSQEAAKNLENRSLIPSIDPLTADTSISISVPSPLPPPPPPCNITSNLNDSHTKDQQKHLP